MRPITTLATAASIMAAGALHAQDVRITTFKGESTYSLNDNNFTVTRNQDTSAVLGGDFARTSRACPPDCLQPITLSGGVATLGELEVLRFLEGPVSGGSGLLLDTRTSEDFVRGSIPGAVNVPVSTLNEENRFRDDILRALGAVSGDGDALDFTNAMTLAVFSGGVWSNEAPTAVSNLLLAGYPPEKILYYRGGMQAWVHVGLTVQNPG